MAGTDEKELWELAGLEGRRKRRKALMKDPSQPPSYFEQAWKGLKSYTSYEGFAVNCEKPFTIFCGWPSQNDWVNEGE